MRLYCHCLNIRIHFLKTLDEKKTLTEFVPEDLGQFVNNLSEWTFVDVKTDEDVQIVWPSLVQIKTIREMKLHRCVNCHLFTHLTNIQPNRILINRDLFNENNVESVVADPNYSTITKILLPITVENSVTTSRISNSQDEQQQQQHDFALAQQMYRKSVEEIEREVEIKIQMFQREQERILAMKTDQLKRELNTFLDLVRSVSRHESSTKTSPTSNSYINENSTESGFGSDIFEIGAMDSGRTTSMNDRGFSDRLENSDEETNDDPMLDSRGWPVENSNVSNFATSLPRTITLRPVPIALPTFRQDGSPDDLERIGKSFRDLSRSMCTDGTELFGELPSPRMNTRHT